MLKVATVCSGVEVWKDITEYEGLYQVSNIGRIKSLERYSANQWSEKAKDYNIAFQTVSEIKNKKIWAWVS